MKYPQSILVSGGCGFVGSAVVSQLLADGDIPRIVVFDNLFNGRRDFLPESPRLAIYDGDVRDGEAIHRVVAEERPEFVIHLAALHFIPYCNAHPAQTLEVNVVGTQNLLDACRVHAPAKIVAASSMAVYPIKEGPNHEEDSPGPTDIYGLSKWINEQQLELFAQQTNIPCAAARLSNIYGPNETNPHVIPEIFAQVADGQSELSLGNIKPQRDYIYVSDVARALLAIALGCRQQFRVYNVGTGMEYSVEEIVTRLARLSGRPLQIRVASDRVRKADRMHLLADRRRISEELGWHPEYTLDRGLAELWRWYTERSGALSPALAAP
jgi:UDP-glucose 4-epimerase